MYIRLTSRCNMSCAHCGFACSSRGQDMKPEVFSEAVQLSYELGESITLGGGEPTIHPRFWEYFGAALAKSNSETSLFIVTNGKNDNIAIALARMAKVGVISAALSQDPWHDPISEEVIWAFAEDNARYSRDGMYRFIAAPDSHDLREIRNVSNGSGVISAGRAKTNQIGSQSDCLCDELFVNPNGKIYACACRKESFGTVVHPLIPDAYFERDNKCSKEQYDYS